MAYQHSEAFKALKQTKEEIASNLTSSQYLSTLDLFLWNALAPIQQECPDFFNNFIAKCVSYQTLNPNNKYTSDDKQKLPVTLFNYLTTKDADKAKLLYLNRGILFGLISTFLKVSKPYVEAQSGFGSQALVTRARALISALGCKRPEYLYALIQQVTYWDNKARWFKSIIIQKYTRLALMQAQKTYTEYNHIVRLDDVSQIYLMMVSKAIDRCDSRLGVLTTFIQNWLKSAKALVASQAKQGSEESLDSIVEEYGDAFTIAVLPDQSSELIQEIAYKAREVDPEGVVRTHLGIPQYVNRQYRELLYALSIE